MQLTLIADVDVVRTQAGQLPKKYAMRSVQDHDWPALAKLYFAAYSREIVPDLSAASAEMQRTLVGEYGPLVAELSPVVIVQQMVVASVMTVAQAPWPDTPAGPFVIEVITHPQHQRRGLAKAGLVWVASKAQAQGLSSLALRVEAENKGARALYHGLGFRQWHMKGEDKHRVPCGGRRLR